MNSEIKKNKVALIIGGSGGIGVAVIDRFLADGFFVCATYAHDGPKAEAVKERFKDNQVAFYKMDLLQRGAVGNMFKAMREEHPILDVVVFGPTLPKIHKALLECSWADFEAHLYVQLRGMVEIVEHLKAQILARQPIRFVVLLTEACLGKPPSHMSAYVTAKYALMGFTKTLATELGRYQCTANMIFPGMVKTELLADFPAKVLEFAGAIAKPEEVARIALFLSSNSAAQLNGAYFNLKGDQIAV